MKKIILCADDYGQNQSISQAILTLIEKKRVSATSCMTTSSHWPEHAQWLKPFKGQVELGLHFNLTDGVPVSTLIKQAYLHRLKASVVEAELHAQLDRFETAIGCPPDYIDGHQHIHQLPIIRDVLFNVYEQRLRQYQTYIRCVYVSRVLLKRNIKMLIIQLLCGSAHFRKELIKRKIPHNASFAGIYSFQHSAQYADIFPSFLTQISDHGLIMCHPGLGGDAQSDAIARARRDEFHYFASEGFLGACKRNDIVIEKSLLK